MPYPHQVWVPPLLDEAVAQVAVADVVRGAALVLHHAAVLDERAAAGGVVHAQDHLVAHGPAVHGQDARLFLATTDRDGGGGGVDGTVRGGGEGRVLRHHRPRRFGIGAGQRRRRRSRAHQQRRAVREHERGPRPSAVAHAERTREFPVHHEPRALMHFESPAAEGDRLGDAQRAAVVQGHAAEVEGYRAGELHLVRHRERQEGGIAEQDPGVRHFLQVVGGPLALRVVQDERPVRHAERVRAAVARKSPLAIRIEVAARDQRPAGIRVGRVHQGEAASCGTARPQEPRS